MNNHTAIINLLKKTLASKEEKNKYNSGFITCPKAFINFMGDMKGGFILNQLIFWSDKTEDPDGWMYKSYEEWQKELPNISKYIIYSRTEWLKDLSILETEERPHPYKLNIQKFYRLDIEKFMEIFGYWLKGNLIFSSHSRQIFDDLSSKISHQVVKNLTISRQKFDSTAGEASLESDNYHAVENNQVNTITPPHPPMEQLQPDKEEVVITIPLNHETIAQRIKWLTELGINSNKTRHKIANDTTWRDEDFAWAIETRNSYIENDETPPDGGIYAAYFLHIPDKKHGGKRKLWKCKPKEETPEFSPELTKHIAENCEKDIETEWNKDEWLENERKNTNQTNEWQEVKLNLERIMTQATYNNVISRLECEKTAEGHFTLYGDKNSLEWIENRLKNTIEQAFKTTLRIENVTLIFEEK